MILYKDKFILIEKDSLFGKYLNLGINGTRTGLSLEDAKEINKVLSKWIEAQKK